MSGIGYKSPFLKHGQRGDVALDLTNLNRLMDEVARARIKFDHGFHVMETADGTFVSLAEYKAQITEKRLFDLYDPTATTVKVRGFALNGDVNNPVVPIGGVWTACSNLDSALTIAADSYIVLRITRSSTAAAVAAVVVLTTVPNGTDTATEAIDYWPLHHLSWKVDGTPPAGRVDWDDCFDLRDIYGVWIR